MKDLQTDSLTYDPIHGYIPFSAEADSAVANINNPEVFERQIVDHPWVQRMRQIHQLQTAWWVFPAAEHTRFQHVIGVMHLAGRAAQATYESLRSTCPGVPSLQYVESLMRLAGLLHDVGHGPFGHFFDQHFLSHYGLNHETLGSVIIQQELGDQIRRVRRNPNGQLADNETLDPAQISFLVTRPGAFAGNTHSGSAVANDGHPLAVDPPRWLVFLRSLFSGIYTVDNMDFVLRDAYMSGYSGRAFDLDRLLRYSFFSDQGLTIHSRGFDALIRFMSVRGELFRTIYFHRTVRAIDLTLKDLFTDSRELLFSGNPLEHLAEYRHFTEWSLLVDVARWYQSADPKRRALGERWHQFLNRQIRWTSVCQRTIVFGADDSEAQSIFRSEAFVKQELRTALPSALKSLPLRVDISRHVHRPDTRGPAPGQNFLFDGSRQEVRPLTDDQLYRQLPLAYRICRVYAETTDYSTDISAALDRLIGPSRMDDLTNM